MEVDAPLRTLLFSTSLVSNFHVGFPCIFFHTLLIEPRQSLITCPSSLIFFFPSLSCFLSPPLSLPLFTGATPLCFHKSITLFWDWPPPTFTNPPFNFWPGFPSIFPEFNPPFRPLFWGMQIGRFFGVPSQQSPPPQLFLGAGIQHWNFLGPLTLVFEVFFFSWHVPKSGLMQIGFDD